MILHVYSSAFVLKAHFYTRVATAYGAGVPSICVCCCTLLLLMLFFKSFLLLIQQLLQLLLLLLQEVLQLSILLLLLLMCRTVNSHSCSCSHSCLSSRHSSHKSSVQLFLHARPAIRRYTQAASWR